VKVVANVEEAASKARKHSEARTEKVFFMGSFRDEAYKVGALPARNMPCTLSGRHRVSQFAMGP
jgi:hypothetical protein